jgi:diguanylate cyclase (GGDEF)-like protein/PAS domain S-box-containing protein
LAPARRAVAVLEALGRVVRDRVEPGTALDHLLDRLRSGLGAEHAVLLLLAADGTPVLRAASGPAASADPAPWQDAVRRTTARGTAQLDGTGPTAVAAAPLVSGGTVTGALAVTAVAGSTWDPSDLALLVLAADAVCAAVERAGTAEREQSAISALLASEQRARAVLETAVDAILTIDVRGVVVSMNPAAERMFGYAAAEVVGRNVSMLMPTPYRVEHDGYLDRYGRTGERRIIGIGREVLGQRRDGTTFPCDLAVSEVGSQTGMFTGVLRDITERKQFEARLAEQAMHDPLTGLANRTLLREHLDAGLHRLRRHPGLLTLFFLDLDRFKAVNDNLGHEAGDELLVHVADLLRATVREQDVVARLGGDEFVVLCDDLADQDAAEALAERITSSLHVPVRVRGQELFVSASVGVVTTTGCASASQLLRDADAAMYQAKDQGRGRYSLLDAAARADMTDRAHLRNDLQRVLERDELCVEYQPLVDLRTGEVVGTEALVRWDHPVRGRLAPGAFLSLALELRLLGEIDAWMLRAACGQAAQWGRELGRPLAVWVNLSSQSLADARLPERVADALHGSGLPPHLLTLEITEDTVMQDAARTIHLLQDLRGIGVQLAVDDFGTGYSSLSYLQQFPVQALKIDASFVGRLDDGRMSEDGGSRTITRAVVNLASGLDLRTVAEGIETAGQLTAVAGLGCDLGQGWWLGRPAAPADALRLLREGVLLSGRAQDIASA